MTSKDPAIEANIAGAKAAARQMLAQWARWKEAKDETSRSTSMAKYISAATSCKVYVESYLKHLYPEEDKTPPKVLKDVRELVEDIDLIENVTEHQLLKVFRDLDQLSKDAA